MSSAKREIESRYLTQKEAANYLRISVESFRRYVKSDRLPRGVAITPGSMLWRIEDLDKAFEDASKSPDAPKRRGRPPKLPS